MGMGVVGDFVKAHYRGVSVAGTLSIVTFFLGRKEKWSAERTAKREKRLDGRVMTALEDHTLWDGSRPMTGGGDMAVRADELAEHLKEEIETIYESLERLESKGRIYNMGGHLGDPTPRFHSLRRF